MPYCHHCGRKLEQDNSKFCKYCGKKIGGPVEKKEEENPLPKEENEEPEEKVNNEEVVESKGKKKGGFLWVIGAIVIIVAIFLIINTSNGNVTGNVVKTLKNCRDVEIPYQVTEEYDYYIEARDLGAFREGKFNLEKGVYQEGKVSLKNVESEGGWFIVTFNWETLDDKWVDEVRHYIEPDETMEFISIYNTDLGEDSKFTYISKSEPITKTRTVTKYRVEEQCD